MYWYIDFLERTIGAERAAPVGGTKDDKAEIIESSIIRVCALWETLVENDLIDCLNLDSTKLSKYLQLDLPDHLNKDLCEAILLGTTYLDFKKVGNIKGFAKNILPPYINPFRLIEGPTEKKIDEAYTMRNYISHYSSKAKRGLCRMYQNSYNIRRFREPGDFLLSYGGNRLNPYITAFLDASEQMRGIIS